MQRGARWGDKVPFYNSSETAGKIAKHGPALAHQRPATEVRWVLKLKANDARNAGNIPASSWHVCLDQGLCIYMTPLHLLWQRN
jgi:hypothetical protein